MWNVKYKRNHIITPFYNEISLEYKPSIWKKITQSKLKGHMAVHVACKDSIPVKFLTGFYMHRKRWFIVLLYVHYVYKMRGRFFHHKILMYNQIPHGIVMHEVARNTQTIFSTRRAEHFLKRRISFQS